MSRDLVRRHASRRSFVLGQVRGGACSGIRGKKRIKINVSARAYTQQCNTLQHAGKRNRLPFFFLVRIAPESSALAIGAASLSTSALLPESATRVSVTFFLFLARPREPSTQNNEKDSG